MKVKDAVFFFFLQNDLRNEQKSKINAFNHTLITIPLFNMANDFINTLIDILLPKKET